VQIYLTVEVERSFSSEIPRVLQPKFQRSRESIYRAYFHDDESRPRVFRRGRESISCRNNAAESSVSKFSGSRSKSLTLISYIHAIRYVFLSHDMCIRVRVKKESSRFDMQHSAVDFVMTLLYTSMIFLLYNRFV